MLDRIDDTIVAISSAPGYGQVGIVRVSGPDTFALLDRMTRLGDARLLSQCLGFSRVKGEVFFDDSPCGLPATFFVFRAPNSYTRQHLVEIHTVGAPVALRAIREWAVTLGAVHAQPGEFTARAFLSGRLSLTQAEGVAAVIRAQTDTQLRAARRMMDGDLAMRVTSLRDNLAGLLALIEADIDFAEEPIEFITPQDLSDRLREACADLDDLISSSRPAEQTDALPHVLLLGPPNAGKSTLMNRLSKTDRAICAAVAGTTRDLLAAPIDLGGVEAILLDSAGIDERPDGREAWGEIEAGRETEAPGDREARAAIERYSEMEAQGQAVALERAGAADVVCLVIDATRPAPEGFLEAVEAAAPARIVVALNKIDATTPRPCPLPAPSPASNLDGLPKSLPAPEPSPLPNPLRLPASSRSVIPAEPSPATSSKASELSAMARLRALGPICEISALRGDGLHELVQRLSDALGASPTTAHGEAVVLTARQNEAIHAAASVLGRALTLCAGVRQVIDCADLMAFELREAVDVLGSVTGEVSTEDLLNRIFADFCIGK